MIDTDPIFKQIAAFERMTVGQLQRRYTEVFGEAARSGDRGALNTSTSSASPPPPLPPLTRRGMVRPKGRSTSMRQRFHRHLSYSSFLLTGAAICLGMSGCQFSKTLESHDPSIVPQGDVPLEASTVAAIRALPSIICGLRTGDGQLAVFAVHVALPAAEPGQPIYVVHTKSVNCNGYACSVVTQVRAMPEGPAWRNAELTVRRCDSVDAATSWLAEPHHGSEGTAAPSTQLFVWRGDAWIAR